MLALALALAACSTEEPVVEAAAPAPVTVALNWYPEPEFGGIYEADLAGLYTAEGLDVTIQGGGAGAPVVPQVATGRVQFGVSSADEVILARSQGADVVAIFATYQTHPACIMVHASRGLKDLSELNSGKLALEDGIPFAQWLYAKFPFEGVTRMPYQGGVAHFLTGEDHAQQAYVTSEPFLAKKEGGDPVCFLVADTGYNPYANVVITSGAMIRDHEPQVRAFVQATRAGWDAYLKDGARANAKIHELNPTLAEDVIQGMWEAQKPLVAGGHAEKAGVGAMEEARWVELLGQLEQIGALKGDKPAPADLFTNRWLPGAAAP